MRVLLTTWGSRGDVEPLAGLAVALRELGAEVRVCAPPDEEFAALLERVGVPLVPLGPSVRSVVTGERPDAFRLAAALVAARFDTLTAAAEECDALLATGLMPAGARDVAARVAELGIGAAHEGSTPTVDSLSAALITALTPETRARARAVADTIRADGATVAAKQLLDAANRKSRP
ncbi:UDP:flavonoid glycosyltransferase YjiC (YdhE family) [Saccharopolyspora phatthalungensis]|uniref:UDP:flavonoid glycosyltransferase YjiC (YdhE family) n=1 Tax=Saccharopolyspora phatthalungensis TaxID=664693 RepID=A0A840QH41_9PSEU|nr:UDP:flavonoid glycosyltransferase YjiC (YdhE family) [Saccharopolyspora phatthalungensis]